MYFKKTGNPEVDELVVCTVTNVQYNSVFVTLDDYGKQALIHISEVSPGRIRNIRDFVKEGKVVVCKVLKVNLDRGHIDVSLRRVNESQRRSIVEDRKAEVKAEKIIEEVAKKLGQKPQEVYDVIAGCLLKKYELLTYAFNDVVENESDLSECGLEKKYLDPLLVLIKERIKPLEVSILGTMKVKIYASDGVTIVREALMAADAVSDTLMIRNLGGGSWRCSVVAKEFKDAEKVLKEAIDIVQKRITEHGGEFAFVRE